MSKVGSKVRTFLGPEISHQLILLKNNMRHVLRAWRMRGERVYCPCCERSFRDFVVTQAVTRRKGECPFCGARERHRMTMLFLREKTSLFIEGGRLMHVAPEPTFMKQLRGVSKIEYVSIDLESPLADVRMDLTDLYFRDDLFDYVICSHVLEHVPDDRKAMAEIYRVLRPGGIAILMVPLDYGRKKTDEDPSITDPAERLRRFNQEDHVRIYGTDYFDRLREAGFDVTLDRSAETMNARELRRLGLKKDDPVVVCTKP